MHPNDHRSLARRLDLFHIDEDAPGMVFWHPAGHRVHRALEAYIRERMAERGYEEVVSPQLMPRSLWEKSGHWEKFGEHMFVADGGDDRQMALKPMSCPCHLRIFSDVRRSWRELPFRLCEFGVCHRNEPSGSMHGLMRSRSFVQDDAHVICRPDQVAAEIAGFVDLLGRVYADFGMVPEVKLALRPDRRAGSDAVWDEAEAALQAGAAAAGLQPELLPGEGAFYGPKMEFHLRDREGRSWQCGVIQVDMVLPERMGASYVAPDGSRAVPVMLHHAVFGSMGRFIGILLEHCEGRPPFWLAPDQIAVLPISDAQEAAALDLVAKLRSAGLRPQLFRGESLSRRLVSVHEALIPVAAVIGRREAVAGVAMVKGRNGDEVAVSIDDLVHRLAGAARSRREPEIDRLRPGVLALAE